MPLTKTLLTLTFITILSQKGVLVAAIHRTLGPVNDPHFANVSSICGASDPKNWAYGTCPNLISCALTNLTPDVTAGLGAGANVAALIPTILALIGTSPLEITLLGLRAPHRAIATACFGIGLPNGLFRQLRPVHSRVIPRDPADLRVREWIVLLATPCQKRWQTLIRRVTIDFVILAAAAVMIWQLWIVNSYTMVSWRCEWGFLLILWPMTCLAWFILAVGSLLFMKESVEIFNTKNPSKHYGMWEFLALPYQLSRQSQEVVPAALPTVERRSVGIENEESADKIKPNSHADVKAAEEEITIISSASRSKTADLYGEYSATIRITMGSNFGLRSWATFECLIETVALGIYLYATFALTGTLFLATEQAVALTAILIFCQCIIRVLAILC